MRKTRLSSSEIQDLINKYQSELKKLEFQTEEIVSTINELEDWLGSVVQSENSALEKMKKKKGVTSSKNVAPHGIKLRRGRPPKGTKTLDEDGTVSGEIKKGYKLSNWDKWVITSISQNDKPQITQEIIGSVTKLTQEAGFSTNDTEIKNKVIRSLQKLANRRGDLVKVPYKGKGHAYAIPGMPGLKRTVGRKTKK